jgi:hypothetical protein
MAVLDSGGGDDGERPGERIAGARPGAAVDALGRILAVVLPLLGLRPAGDRGSRRAVDGWTGRAPAIAAAQGMSQLPGGHPGARSASRGSRADTGSAQGAAGAASRRGAGETRWRAALEPSSAGSDGRGGMPVINPEHGPPWSTFETPSRARTRVLWAARHGAMATLRALILVNATIEAAMRALCRACHASRDHWRSGNSAHSCPAGSTLLWGQVALVRAPTESGA